MKDWTGNNRTLGATLGASYLASGERPREDYYATHPDMVRDLLNAGAPLRKRVWEPACGAGHIVNVLRERLLCVRGNCDTEVDQMVLDFPILADYALLYAGSRTVFATHGHHYNTACPPPLAKGDILLHGHTHVPAWQEFGSGNLYLNPGSVAIPKENSAHSYIMLTDSGFAWKDLEGSIYHTLALDCPNCG